MEDSCIFCKILDGSIKAEIVYEDDEVMAFNDIKPQAPTHVIVIPKRHIERVSDINKGDSSISAKLVLAANKIASERRIVESGYRLVVNCNKDAGQEVFHLHLHLLGGRRLGWPPG